MQAGFGSGLTVGRRVAWALVLTGLIAASPRPSAQGAVYLEDSPAAKELADEADRLLAEGRAGEAAQRLHRVVDEFPDKLMPRDTQLYVDARLWVRQRLAADDSLLQAYRARFAAEAEKALADAQEAAGEQRAARVRAVWETYALTPAGLDAALYLAGTLLEKADVDGCAAVLSELPAHPDWSRRRPLYHELSAWAAAMAGRDEHAWQQALERLEALGQSQAAASLAQTFAEMRRPGAAAAADDATPAWSPPPLDRPLWEVEIETAESSRLRTSRSRRIDAPQADLKPVASERLLLFNDNLRVFALDRTSGRLRWVHRLTDPASGPDDRAAFNALGRAFPDSREVLLRGRWAYGVLGYVSTTVRGRRRAAVPQATELVCLDVDSGEPRWVTTPGKLDPSLEWAAFHGTPVSCGDAIIVAARRSQASSFQDSYLMAVDAVTGELRWRRHLASTAGAAQRNAPTALSSVALHGHRLYFCDNLGAAASIDALSGTVHWIRTLTPPHGAAEGLSQRRVRPLSQGARPVLAAAGLLLPLQVDQAYGLLLDPDTGELKRGFAAESLVGGAGRFLPLAGGDLLAVGQALHRLDGQTLEARWTYSSQRSGPPQPGVPAPVTLDRGTALLGAGTKHIDAVDLATGRALRHHELPWTGSVLSLGDAWVVSSGPRIGSYLDWPKAYAELKRRAHDSPRSTGPGLSLATLALNAGQSEALGEGVGLLALAALGAKAAGGPDAAAHEAQRLRTFYELLGLAEQASVAQTLRIDPAVIESLFDQLASITQTPAQLVAYNLSRGEYLQAQQRLAEAAEYYQAVLLDPRLSDELWRRNQTTRRADLVAQQRLFELLQAHGRGFYRDFDARAQQEFVALEADPASTASDLRDLVRRYPLARVAAAATLAAADRQAGGSGQAGAAVQYRRAFQLAEDDGVRARAAGALAGYYQDRGQTDAAINWLKSLSRRHPGLRPRHRGEPRDVGAWLDELRTRGAAPGAAPGIRLPLGAPRKIQGTLLIRQSNTGPADSAPGALVQTRGGGGEPRLVFHGFSDGLPHWDVESPDLHLTLVHAGVDNLMLWSRTKRTLYGFDTATGRQLWPPIDAAQRLGELGEGGLAPTRRAHAGQVIELIEQDLGPIRARERPDQRAKNSAVPRVVASESSVCVIDNRGRAIGIDRYTGRLLWQSALPVDTVSHLALGPDGLAVGGLAAPGTEAQAGRVILLDQVTGRMRFPVVEDDQAVSALRLLPDHGLLVLGQSRLSLLSTDHGTTLWRVDLEGRPANRQIHAAGDALFVFNNAALISLDPVTGERRALVTDPDRISQAGIAGHRPCLLYTSPSPRDQRGSRMPSSA